MRCPIDETELIMSDRQGVEVDYCPKCRGVWLDRGELDKIIERGGTLGRRDDDDDWDDRRYERREDYDRERSYGGRRRKKRKSFLDDLFDFG